MKYVPTNRMFNGVQVKVRNCETGLDWEGPIDISEVSPANQIHILRLVEDGDMKPYFEPPMPDPLPLNKPKKPESKTEE